MSTDGFTAFTAETARVKQITEDQPVFPNVTLEDSNRRTYSFDEFKGKYVFITFLYTGCTTVCPKLEANMSEVYKSLPKKYIGEDIVFLSITFDPTRDDPTTLDKYKNLFDIDGETWRMARISKQSELTNLLNRFGVIVIPDGKGNFAHNSAFYLMDKKGVLIKVMDDEKTEEASNNILNILERERKRK